MNNQFPNNSSPYGNVPQGQYNQTPYANSQQYHQGQQYSQGQQSPYVQQYEKTRSGKKSITGVIVLVSSIIAAFLLAAIFLVIFLAKRSEGEYTEQSKKWVKKMNDTFPDDHFEFSCYDEHYSTGLWSTKNKDMIVVKSKNHPNKKVLIGWNSDKSEVVTNYNYLRYLDEETAYYEDTLQRYLKCDDLNVHYIGWVDKFTSVKDYDAEKFLEDYLEYDIWVYLKYEGDFPSESEMTKNIEQLIKDEGKPIVMDLNLSHTKVDEEDLSEGSESYTLYMDSATHIGYLTHGTVHYLDKEKTNRRVEHVTIYEDKDLK